MFDSDQFAAEQFAPEQFFITKILGGFLVASVRIYQALRGDVNVA
jgi:hypothetical protein